MFLLNWAPVHLGRELAAQHGARRRGRRHAPPRQEVQLHLQTHEGQCQERGGDREPIELADLTKRLW